MTVQLRMADDPTINRLVVIAIIIVLLVVAAWVAVSVAVWVFHAVDRHERHMKSLWPFENSTYYGSVEDHMDEIRGLPEVEAFHEMYEGRDIVFTNYSMNPVEFDYAASDDNRSAYLIIRYYDREPSDFSHQCSDKVLRRGLFMEDSVRTDCFSYVATDIDAP